MKCTNCGTGHDAKFCPECGTPAQQSTACASCGTVHSAKFCPECGIPAGTSAPAAAPQPTPAAPSPKSAYEEITLWEGKPAGFMDKAVGAINKNLNDVTFTVTNQRIIIQSGIIGRKQSEIELRHVKDTNVKQSLIERASKVGDITIISDDPTMGNIVMDNVPDPIAVKEIIRKAVLEVRANLNIVHHESM